MLLQYRLFLFLYRPLRNTSMIEAYNFPATRPPVTALVFSVTVTLITAVTGCNNLDSF